MNETIDAPRGVTITGTGSYVPERVLTNDDLSRMVDTSDEWIRTRTGMVERRLAREAVEDGEFIEVHVDTPLALAEERDPKGLYAKARRGELANFTGIDSPYEPREAPEVVVDTTSMTPEEAADEIIESATDDQTRALAGELRREISRVVGDLLHHRNARRRRGLTVVVGAATVQLRECDTEDENQHLKTYIFSVR